MIITEMLKKNPETRPQNCILSILYIRSVPLLFALLATKLFIALRFFFFFFGQMLRFWSNLLNYMHIQLPFKLTSACFLTRSLVFSDIIGECLVVLGLIQLYKSSITSEIQIQ